MAVLDELERLLRLPLGQGGDAPTARAAPGLDREAIAGITARVGAALPADLDTLLARCGGISGLTLEIDFTGGFPFEMDDIFPHALPIAADGHGNFWVVDCAPPAEADAAIFFACHDPPVILWQVRGVARFLGELARLHTPPGASLLRDVMKDGIHQVWRTDHGAMTRAAALASPDPAVRTFGEGLDEAWTIVDLRRDEPGTGFAWGRSGPDTPLRRHGDERLFAYARPERPPGLLARLFGG